MTPERQALKAEALRLRRELGWSNRRIAEHLGVPRRTIDLWLIPARSVTFEPTKSNTSGHNARTYINQAEAAEELGCTQQRIADEIGRPRQTVSDWLLGKVQSTRVGKGSPAADNHQATNADKPLFKSWCGNIEDFQPEGNLLFDLILMDPPWALLALLGGRI